jgi:hypothetical protein
MCVCAFLGRGSIAFSGALIGGFRWVVDGSLSALGMGKSGFKPNRDLQEESSVRRLRLVSVTSARVLSIFLYGSESRGASFASKQLAQSIELRVVLFAGELVRSGWADRTEKGEFYALGPDFWCFDPCNEPV